MNKENYKKLISDKAFKLGFSFCGFSKVGFLEEEAKRLETWLSDNNHGEMSYMENHFDKRLNPALLVDGAKTVVSLLYNYYSPLKQKDPEAPKISKYAYGKDYHFVIKDKLKELFQFIQKEIGQVSGRSFVDSAPVMDKVWAKKSGIGWIGKNTNLITRENGSFLFVSELIIDLELPPDGPIKDYCGTCTKCIDTCPTEALTPYQIDGSKCISYLTIELKDSIPEDFKGKMDNWMFGCDVCQDVCPWNRFSKEHSETNFHAHPNLLNFTKYDWEKLSEEDFRETFRKSAVKRTKYSGLTRNIKFIT